MTAAATGRRREWRTDRRDGAVTVNNTVTTRSATGNSSHNRNRPRAPLARRAPGPAATTGVLAVSVARLGVVPVGASPAPRAVASAGSIAIGAGDGLVVVVGGLPSSRSAPAGASTGKGASVASGRSVVNGGWTLGDRDRDRDGGPVVGLSFCRGDACPTNSVIS